MIKFIGILLIASFAVAVARVLRMALINSSSTKAVTHCESCGANLQEHRLLDKTGFALCDECDSYINRKGL